MYIHHNDKYYITYELLFIINMNSHHRYSIIIYHYHCRVTAQKPLYLPLLFSANFHDLIIMIFYNFTWDMDNKLRFLLFNLRSCFKIYFIIVIIITVLYWNNYTLINTFDHIDNYYRIDNNNHHPYFNLNDSSNHHTISLYNTSSKVMMMNKPTSVIIFKLPRSGSSWFTELLNK